MEDDPFIRVFTLLEAQATTSDNGSLLTGIIIQIAMIALNAIFACAEISIISLNDNLLAKQANDGNKKAKTLLRLTSLPAKFLATIQVGITAVNLLASAFASQNFSVYLIDFMQSIGIPFEYNVLNTISTVIITIILLYFTVVFGELVPKRLAMRNPERFAFALCGLVNAVSVIFNPIVSLLSVSTNGILRLFGIDPNQHEENVTEEEIRMMVDVGTEKGAIDQDEKQMIQNIFEFDDIAIGEIVTHRTEVSLLWLEESDEEWFETIRKARHTLYPVCDESPDNIVGVLNSKDYFRLDDKSRNSVLKKAVKPAYFVPETIKADILFQNMKKTRNHFAVVLDEYGGMTGIVTMNDLLEELVGDLEDDDTVPQEEPFIEKIDSHTWKVQGIMPLDLLAEELKISLPIDDFETFGGLVFDLFGEVPDDGTTPELEGYGLTIKVLEIKEHRLEKALICLSQPITQEQQQ